VREYNAAMRDAEKNPKKYKIHRRRSSYDSSAMSTAMHSPQKTPQKTSASPKKSPKPSDKKHRRRHSDQMADLAIQKKVEVPAELMQADGTKYLRMRAVWYKPTYNRSMAETLLAKYKQAPGSFIVRESDSKPGKLVLSYMTLSAQVGHVLLDVDPKTKRIEIKGKQHPDISFSSLEQLAVHLGIVDNTRLDIYLSDAYPRDESLKRGSR